VRVLKEAAGNPLALVELPSAAEVPDDEPSVPGGIALTERLERAFAARAFELPEATRTVLLVAALNDENDIGETLEAASTIAGVAVDLDAVAPASAAGIVDADLHTLRFRHPLMRSALAGSSGLIERRLAHEALADKLADQPERRAWHRAALLSGEHEDVAVELEETAARARHRGAVPVAVTAMRRAAEIGAPASRSRRLLAAVALAAEGGRRDVVVPLLREARQLHLGELDRARLTLVEETVVTRPLDSKLFMSLIGIAEQAGAAGDHDLHADLLWLVAQRAWWVDPGAEVRQSLVRASRRLGDPSAQDPRVVAVHAYADPFGQSAALLDRLESAVRGEQLDPDAARFFGPAALVVGAFDIGNDFLAAAIDGLRAQGRLGLMPRLLMLHACVAARIGDWETAITAADEARRLAEEFADPQVAAPANTAYSLVAAMRGDEETAEVMAARAEAVAEPVGANITMAFAQFGKVLAALAGGRHADAFASANRLFEPGDSAYHPFISCWLIADLAEAGRHIDELKAARGRMEQVEAVAGERPGAWIEIGLRHARALLAEPADAGERFGEALALDLTRWPFQRARIQLGYGQWLRRQRRVVESRTVLRAARDTFDALGCAPWGDQARRELRASGERSLRRAPEARDQLTAQELQIAQLAAKGLSNREIGQRLFLSHRTIGSHLYKVFPKLGITSRTELGTALAPTLGGDDPASEREDQSSDA
jgi:DNA-binding CsgD family transcriptional regulator